MERSKTFRRRVDAEGFLAQVESAKLRGEWIDPRLGRMRLREHWERLEPMLSARVRPSTIELYRGLWSTYLEPELGARPIAGLTRLELEEFVGRMSAAKAGPATVGATVRLLHRILQAAVDTRLIAANPAHRLGRPALPQAEMRFLAPEEVERLVDCTPDEWKAFVMLAAWCGLRFGEIAALKVERVDFLRRRRIEETVSEVAGHLHVGPTKTKGKRSVAAPLFVIDAIARHVEWYPPARGGLLFRSPAGGTVRRTNFRNRVWRPAVEAAGLEPLRFHDLRHTAVALAIAAGAHAKAIQARLGHSSVTMTLDRYGHLMEGLDTDIAARLDQLRQTAWRRPESGGEASEGRPRERKKPSEQGF